MKITDASTNGLKLLHEAIKYALIEDDLLPVGSKRYEVRESPDWRAQSEEIEAELIKRSEPVSFFSW
jgi:hypothetical protein